MAADHAGGPSVHDQPSVDGQPLVHSQPQAARSWTQQQVAQGRRVALVPTMGALHRGHLELVRQAHRLADCVAVSIFVNPTQFGPQEDFQRYPRTFDDDLQQLRREGVAMVFAPSATAIYGEQFSTFVSPPAVAQPLEGRFRPEHFRGVCTIVLKLFHIVPAQVAVFGQKDYQQARVIAAMVNDLDLPIQLEIVPTVREPDGLAMSSRNRYLSAAERTQALGLSRALAAAAEAYRGGQQDAGQLAAVLQSQLEQAGVDRIDYAVVVDPLTLLPLSGPLPPAHAIPPAHARPDQPAPPDNPSALNNPSAFNSPPAAAVALIAAHVGGTRLIDNRLLP